MQKGFPESKRVALGKHLRFCKDITLLGVKTNFEDYSPQEKDTIREAREVFYPTALYYRLFESMGKKVFPRNFYPFMGNKIRQTLLFQWLGIPHPKTRIYYGSDRFRRIKNDFSYPFIAKQAVGGSQGKEVFLINSDAKLHQYLDEYRPAYIQEYIKSDRDLRVVIFGGNIVHAYWRIGKCGDFRHNVAQGAKISLEEIPDDALEFALSVAKKCGFDEVGLDILECNGSYYVLEANMVYGKVGFNAKGLKWEETILKLHEKGLF